jgi:hypothetical protein
MYAPVDIELCRINVQKLFSDPDDAGEGLVNFEQADIIDCQISFLECQWQSHRGSAGKVNRLHANIGVG